MVPRASPMVELFLTALEELIAAIGHFVTQFMWPITGFIAVVGGLTLAYAAVRPADFDRNWTGLLRHGTSVVRVGVIAAVAALCATLLGIEKDVTSEYRAKRAEGTYVAQPGGEGEPMVQSAPYAAVVVEDQKRADSFVPGVQLSTQVIQSLNSSLSMLLRNTPSVPQFEVGSDGLRVKSVVPVRQERRVTIDTAKVHVSLVPRGGMGSRSNAYGLKFEGTYEFANELDQPAVARFSFPIPRNGGTFKNVKFAVDGQPANNSGDDGTYVWTGTVAPGKKLSASMSYETTAAGTWQLEVSTGMRRVTHLSVDLDAPDIVKFAKSSIPFSSHEGGTYKWDLQSLVSAQSISVAVPFERQSRELVAKAFDLARVGVCMLALALCFGRGLAPSLVGLSAFVGAASLPVAFVDSASPVWVLLFGYLIAAAVTFRLNGSKMAAASVLASGIAMSGWLGAYSGLAVLVFGALLVVLMRLKVRTNA